MSAVFKSAETVDEVQSLDDRLPSVSQPMLFQMFARLSLDDKVKALQQKIVAVAWLANITLYGAVGEAAMQQAEESGHRVIASISPSDYRHVVRRVLGRELLRKATFGLRQKLPHFSARERVTTAQVLMLILFSFGLAGSFWIWPSPVIYLFLSLICGLLFLSIIGLRILCLDHRLTTPRTMFPKLSEDDLPIYTILVPVFREVNVLKQLIGALKSLDYPKSELDIKLILEETDIAMQRAVSKIELPDFIEIIVVPAGKPQTKPRALNYALQFARGTLVAIYDAEDIPEPDQLQKAAAKFANGARNLACLQAELTFYNPNENWLTRQFTIEYATLFKVILPALAHAKLPLPLGGTSNHFQTHFLKEVGAWDPFNVTEDADLGLRLARCGYSIDVLDSVTYEEANVYLGNWMQQRARWFKGFLQTWLVHMRNPLVLRREIGTDGIIVMLGMTFAVIFSALIHPIFLAYAVCQIYAGVFFSNLTSHLLVIVAAVNLVVMIVGHSISIYAGFVGLRRKAIFGWWASLATMPIYWLLMSAAAWLALWQFMFNPFHWNKTRHGLSVFQKNPNARTI